MRSVRAPHTKIAGRLSPKVGCAIVMFLAACAAPPEEREQDAAGRVAGAFDRPRRHGSIALCRVSDDALQGTLIVHDTGRNESALAPAVLVSRSAARLLTESQWRHLSISGPIAPGDFFVHGVRASDRMERLDLAITFHPKVTDVAYIDLRDEGETSAVLYGSDVSATRASSGTVALSVRAPLSSGDDRTGDSVTGYDLMRVVGRSGVPFSPDYSVYRHGGLEVVGRLSVIALSETDLQRHGDLMLAAIAVDGGAPDETASVSIPASFVPKVIGESFVIPLRSSE